MAGELRRYWSFAATLSAGTGVGNPHPPVMDVASAFAASCLGSSSSWASAGPTSALFCEAREGPGIRRDRVERRRAGRGVGPARSSTAPTRRPTPSRSQRCGKGIADVDLAAAPVVLPDLHLKADKEMPSSIAVATRETIQADAQEPHAQLRDGADALDLDRPRDRRSQDFYDHVRERFRFQEVPPRPHVRRRPSLRDRGRRFAVDRFGVEPAELERMEEGGRIWYLELTAGASGSGASCHGREAAVPHPVRDDRARATTSSSFKRSRKSWTPTRRVALGIELGQTMLQFHGGGGALASELGVLFGSRKRYPRSLRMQMAVQKPMYHLERARSVDGAATRRALFFSGGFPPVARDGPEGERLMLANVDGHELRIRVQARGVRDPGGLLRESVGAGESRLIVDSPHNSIYEEEVDGQRAIVHRHNSVPGVPGVAHA